MNISACTWFMNDYSLLCHALGSGQTIPLDSGTVIESSPSPVGDLQENHSPLGKLKMLN